MARSHRLVAAWLFGVAAMVAGMVLLGGAARVTGSGLSIMEWAPVSGTLPPGSAAEWQRLFALYQRIPQSALLHPGMDLAGFKGIFWLEWLHRFWGRLIGVAFLVPLIGFWATGRMTWRLGGRLGLLAVLGAAQGGVGWVMVASGFWPDSVAVAPERLVLHLGLALVLYAALLWTGLDVSGLTPAWKDRRVGAGVASAAGPGRSARRLVTLTLGLVALTLAAGGLVAGTHAGLIDNTFPLMAGAWLPPDAVPLHPLAANLVRSLPLVQFDHRLLATATLLVATLAGLRAVRDGGGARAWALVAAVGSQYALGVVTLLAMVPAWLAIAHQAGAIGVLTAALVLAHGLRPRPA